MKLSGYLETMSGTVAKGWAAFVASSSFRQAEIEILINGMPAETTMADIFREDLRDAGVGDGFHSFEIDLGEHLENLKADALISAREKSTGAAIPTLNHKDLVYRPKSQRKTFTLEDLLLRAPVARDFSIVAGDKIAIYATHTASGSLGEDHRKQVAQLQASGYKVIVSHAPGRKVRIQTEADVLLLKQNIGHDFGSWWTGLTYIRERDPSFLDRISALLLLNDSCFGTVSSSVIAAMEGINSDVCGLTDSHQVEHHLQSYCLLCMGDYLKSGDFTDILFNYAFPTSKADVIHEGEINLSRSIIRSGRSIAALHPYDALASRWKSQIATKVAAIYEYYSGFGFDNAMADEEVRTLFHLLRRLDSGFAFNPSHLFWQEIIEAKTPILKKELLLKNPAGIPAPGVRMKFLEEQGIIKRSELNSALAKERISMRFVES